MPKVLLPLQTKFGAQVRAALEVATAGEIALSAAGAHPPLRPHWHYSRVELVYELAFLRVFLGWESFLEETFCRLLCGYSGKGGKETLAGGKPYFRSISKAHSAVLGGQKFKLWHNPDHVISRAQTFFSNGRIEQVLSSNLARIRQMSAVRHRIAHDSSDVKSKFDSATMAFCGARYPGSRAGRFLREAVPGAILPSRWIVDLSNELLALAKQIC